MVKYKYAVVARLLVASMMITLALSSNAQFVALKTSSGCPLTSNGSVERYGEVGGLTYSFPSACAASAWGFDYTTAIKFAFNNITTNTINIYDQCNSNLNRGLVVLTGVSNIRHYNTSGALTGWYNIPIRVTIQFTTDGSTVTPVKRNGDIIFRDMSSAFQVNIKVEANAGSLINPSWQSTTTGVSHSSWSPALDMFDDLKTSTSDGGNVQSTLAANYYKVGRYADVSPVSNIAVSYLNGSAGTFGAIAGDLNGITVRYTNNTGAEAFIGFDAATAFQFRVGGGNFNGGGAVSNYSAGTNYAANQPFSFDGCQPSWNYTTSTSTSATVYNFRTRAEVRFVNRASTWKDGYLYAIVPASGYVDINYRTYIHGGDIGDVFNYGTTANTWIPFRDVFDGANQGQGSFYTSFYIKYFTGGTGQPNYGNTVRWDGSVSTDWKDPCNWDCRVPTWDDDVIIPAAPANWPYVNTATDMSPDNDNGAGTNNAQVKNIEIQGNAERLRINLGDIEIQD